MIIRFNKMQLFLCILAFAIFAGPLLSAELERASPGKPRFVVRTDPSWDAYTGVPDQSMKDWFNSNVWRMMVYAPFFNERLSWYPNAWIYINLYAIPVNSAIVRQHPDWILRDASHRPLYIPYECRGGSCPQYAADPSNPEYRKAWLEKATLFKKKGYKGFWIDDVNLAFRVSDGNGNFQSPIKAGKVMSEGDWGEAVTSFLEDIRKAFPDAEILHNAIWFAGGSQRDRNPLVQRELASCDYINVERGITDPGLKGDNGEWSLNALLSYIDRLHQLGKGVVLDNTGDDYNYGLAGFYMISSGVDALGSHSLRPDHWPQSLHNDLGKPLGERHIWNHLLVREFSGGVAFVNPPDGQTRRISLPATLHSVDSPIDRKPIELPSPGGLVVTGSVSDPNTLEQSIQVN